MHLGLTPWRSDHRAQVLIEQAIFAEQLGYESFWLPENHFLDTAIPDPLMLLACVAGATTKIKLATASYLLPLRHPLHAAAQVAVLDQLSDGRVILGVGRGVGNTMLKAFDVEPKNKRQHFEQNLQVMVKAWSGVNVAADNDDNPEANVILHPLPKQTPHPDIWVAAFGPKALAQAGRLGLPYLASPLETIGNLEKNFALHSQACQDSGRTVPILRPVMRNVFISDDNGVIDKLKKHLAENRDTNQRRSAGAITDDWAVIGNSEFVRNKLAEYQDRLGMTHLIVTHLRTGGLTLQQFRDSLTAISEINCGINNL